MQDSHSALADWQISTREAMLQILKSKGYLSRRYAKATLSQRLINKGMMETRILLGDWDARLAFMEKIYTKAGPVTVKLLNVDHDGEEIRPKKELEPIFWATAADCHLFLLQARYIAQREEKGTELSFSAYTKPSEEVTKAEEKTIGASAEEDGKDEIENDWTVV